MSANASADSLCYECLSKVSEYWCNDCKCGMCGECYTKLHQGRRLSEHQQISIKQKPESSEGHSHKKRKNDTSVLMSNDVTDITKNEQLTTAQECLKEKIDKTNGSVAENENAHIQQIETVFEKLRQMISKHEETLKTQVHATERKNTPSTEEGLKSIERKQQSLSTETALETPKNINYCIDKIDQLESTMTNLLNQVCLTEFAFLGSYVQPDCKGRPCPKCYKCRDWYYKGDMSTWFWIINVKNWDEAERKQWNDGRYHERFERRNGSTCGGSYGHYYDRNRNYHGVHISTYLDCNCGHGYNSYISHNLEGCGYRSRFIGRVFPYCQCLENIKQM